MRILKGAGANPLEQTVGVASAWEAFTADGLADAELAVAVRTLLAQLPGQISTAA